MEKRFDETRAEMGARLEGLEAVIAQLQRQLQQQRDKCMQHKGALPIPFYNFIPRYHSVQLLHRFIVVLHARAHDARARVEYRNQACKSYAVHGVMF